MVRHIICSAVLWAVMLMIPGEVLAAQRQGSIRVYPGIGGDLVLGGSVELYHVGEPKEGGWRVTDGLADWTFWESDREEGLLLDWVLAHLPEAYAVQEVTEEGAYFAGLTDGLYLVRQEEAAPGYEPFSPFLIELPGDGNWQIMAEPMTVEMKPNPQTGDHPAPIIGAMGIGFSVTMLILLADKRK